MIRASLRQASVVDLAVIWTWWEKLWNLLSSASNIPITLGRVSDFVADFLIFSKIQDFLVIKFERNFSEENSSCFEI